MEREEGGEKGRRSTKMLKLLLAKEVRPEPETRELKNEKKSKAEKLKVEIRVMGNEKRKMKYETRKKRKTKPGAEVLVPKPYHKSSIPNPIT